MKELSKKANQNVDRINILGVYKSSEGENLEYGFIEEKHRPMLNELIATLGRDYPIAVLGAAVKHYRKQVIDCKNEIREEMFIADVDEFSTGGLKYEVITEYNASFPKDAEGKPDKRLFFDWLVEKGRGHSIKSVIELPKIDEAERAKNVLREAGLNVNVVREMHGSTLKVLVRELEKLGESAPKEVITVTPQDVLVIKPVKK